MDEKQQAVAAMLKKLAHDFHAQIPDRIHKITRLWQELNENFDVEKQADLFRLSHSLAGTSATFGHSLVSQAAKALELSLQDIENKQRFKDKRPLTSECIERLNNASTNQ